MELTVENVDRILNDCLYKEGEDQTGAVLVEGVVSNFGFHPGRVKNHVLEIEKLLNELPDGFHEGRGGGHTFLNACMDKNGRQWGEHRNIEALIVIGIAANKVKYCGAREMWTAFPGGMPYFVVVKTPARWYDNGRDSHFYAAKESV